MRFLVIVFCLIVAVAGGFLLWTVATLSIKAGVFTEVTYTDNSACKVIKSPAGVEDLVIDRETGWVYLSATDRRWGQGGGLYAMRLEDPERGIIGLTSGLLDDFHPHGISFWTSPDGTDKRIFAVTHSKDGKDHAVEIFTVDDTGFQPVLTHDTTVKDVLFRSPNDVAAVGPRRFYTTNDFHYPQGSLRNSVELYLRLDLTDVVYHDGEAARTVADGLTFANGIALNADGTRVYVAETTDGTVRIYDRDAGSGSLTLLNVVDAGVGPDNIDVDTEGRLWIANHPKLFAFQDHAAKSEALSPSLVQVLSLVGTGTSSVSEEVYIDTGAQISGSSVGAYHEGTLLIGSVFEPHIVSCSGVE